MQKKTRKKNRLATSLSKILQPFLGRLRYEISSICPYGEDAVDAYVAAWITRLVALGICVGLLVFTANYFITREFFSLYSFASSALAVYVVISEYNDAKLNRLRIKIENEFGLYLSSVKDCYKARGSVREAVREAASSYSSDIKKYASFILGILTDDNAATKVQAYINNPVHPVYVRMFLSQCYQCSKKGAAELDEGGVHLFCRHLDLIRLQIGKKGQKEKNNRHKLRGLTIVIVTPSLLMNLYKQLSINFQADSASFYASIGPILQLLALTASLYIYLLLKNSKMSFGYAARDNSARYRAIQKRIKASIAPRLNSHLAKRLETVQSSLTPTLFVLKSLLYFIVGFVAACILMFYIDDGTRRTILKEIPEISCPAQQKEKAQDAIKEIANRHKLTSLNLLTDEILFTEIDELTNIHSITLKRDMADAIKDQISRFQKAYFNYPQMLLCLLVALIAGLIPYISLQFLYGDYLSNMADELHTLQLVIQMNKDFSSMTTYGLLLELQAHAFLFRPILTIAANEYPHNSQRALRFLMTEKNPTFRQLVTGLTNIKFSGVKQAFAGIKADIEFYEEARALEKDISDDNNRIKLNILSAIPSVIAVGIYFIYPFIKGAAGDVLEALKYIS